MRSAVVLADVRLDLDDPATPLGMHEGLAKQISGHLEGWAGIKLPGKPFRHAPRPFAAEGQIN